MEYSIYLVDILGIFLLYSHDQFPLPCIYVNFLINFILFNLMPPCASIHVGIYILQKVTSPSNC